jgi:hypothetical protein
MMDVSKGLQDPEFGADTGQGAGQAGIALQIGAALSSIVGGYYAAKAAREQASALASAFAHKSSIAAVNASMSEVRSHEILKASRQRVGLLRLQTAQDKAEQEVGAGARNVAMGVGSQAEVQASMEAASLMDVSVISRAGLQAAQGERMRALGYRASSEADYTRSLMYGNLRNTYRPEWTGFNTLLNTGAGVAGSVSRYQETYA